MRCGTSLAAWLSLLAACAPQMNYAYQEKLPPNVFGPPDVAEPAGREARLLLASARTVAFYPPDYCINVDKEDVARTRTLRANCGVLLSSLERAAEKAGYEVVSWQNLRGTQRPIDYAREAKVDVLFEINEFDFGEVSDEKLAREVEYSKYPGGGTAEPFTPPGDIQTRCGTYALGRHRKATAGKVGVIDIKTVSVVDGRNRWRYRKSLTRSRNLVYEKVAFGSVPRQNIGGMLLSVFGGIGLAVGGGLVLASAISTDDPTTDTDERVDLGNVPLVTLGAGAALLAAGIAVTVLTSKPGGPELMCGTGTLEPLVTPGSSAVPADEEAENAELRNEMIGEFVQQIVDVRTSMPPPAPDPTAPQPAPAPVSP